MAVASSTEHHETVRSGVRTLWSDIPGDVVGFLVFGIGQRDLAPGFAGLHHLVEHLVMRRVGPVATEHNAASSPDSVVFHASGRIADVVDFLQRVGRAVADLATVTPDEVQLERAAILVEVGDAGVYASADTSVARFGPTGLGMVDLGHAALPSLTADDVRAFAASWFTDGNARLVLTTEPPEDLDLGLPLAPAPSRLPEPPPLEIPGPAYMLSASEGVALQLLVTADLATRWVVADVLVEALRRRLRGELGLVYDVQLVPAQLADGSACWTVLLDPPEASVDAALLAAHQVLTALAEAGPDPELLAHVRAALVAAAHSSDGRIGHLLSVAELHLRDGSLLPRSAMLARTEQITGADVATAIAAAAPTLLLSAPARTGITEATQETLQAAGFVLHQPFATYAGMTTAQITEDLVTDGHPGSGRGTPLRPAMSAHRGRRFSPWRKSEIFIGRDQIAVVDLGGRIRVDDIALLGADEDGDVEIVTRQGGVMCFNPQNFRGAAEPWTRFVAGLPPHVVRHKTGIPSAPTAGS
jgi:hypothetical protein